MDGGVATMPMGSGFQQPRKYFSMPPGQPHQNAQHLQQPPRQNIQPQQNQIPLDPNKDPNQAPGQVVMFDGKRMRKAVHRKTVDYNSAVIKYLEVMILNPVEVRGSKYGNYKVQGQEPSIPDSGHHIL